MKKRNIWVLSGVLYVALVVGGYGLVTGENPLDSGGMHEEDHGVHGE